MGRKPCCAKEGLNRGVWSVKEDEILTNYIKSHGEGHWRDLPQRAGLKRCGKSCRLRWLNYLRPNIKRGNISEDEDELIMRMHKLLGNRWSLIAGRLPGRTDNEIKNYWNTNLRKRAPDGERKTRQVIRTKAVRCTKALFQPEQPPEKEESRPVISEVVRKLDNENSTSSPYCSINDDSIDLLLNFDIDELLVMDILGSSDSSVQVDEDNHEHTDVMGADFPLEDSPCAPSGCAK